MLLYSGSCARITNYSLLLDFYCFFLGVWITVQCSWTQHCLRSISSTQVLCWELQAKESPATFLSEPKVPLIHKVPKHTSKPFWQNAKIPWKTYQVNHAKSPSKRDWSLRGPKEFYIFRMTEVKCLRKSQLPNFIYQQTWNYLHTRLYF